MPVNPHVKGGTDVPVTDGGTGASAGSGALTNLGGLSTASHAVLSHTGIPGVGDLTTATHASLDHSAIPGAGGGKPVATSTTIPANTLSADGQMLLLYIAGTASTWDGSIEINAVPICTHLGNFLGVWSGSFMITRTSSTGGTVTGTIADSDGNVNVAHGIGSVSGLSWGSSQTISVSGVGSPVITRIAAVAMK